jgi:hypothetical protein
MILRGDFTLGQRPGSTESVQKARLGMSGCLPDNEEADKGGRCKSKLLSIVDDAATFFPKD